MSVSTHSFIIVLTIAGNPVQCFAGLLVYPAGLLGSVFGALKILFSRVRAKWISCYLLGFLPVICFRMCLTVIV